MFLSWERRKFLLLLFPFLDCTLCRCLHSGGRGGGPSSSSRQHSTHLRTSPRMERRRDPSSSTLLPPRGKLLFPRKLKLLLPLLNGLLSRKRAAEAEEKEERMVVVYIYFNRGSSPSAFVSCSTVPFPPPPITIFLAAPKSTFPSLFLGGREKEMYPPHSPFLPQRNPSLSVLFLLLFSLPFPSPLLGILSGGICQSI